MFSAVHMPKQDLEAHTSTQMHRQRLDLTSTYSVYITGKKTIKGLLISPNTSVALSHIL